MAAFGRAGAKFVYVPLKSGRYHVRQSSVSRAHRTTGYQQRHIEENFRRNLPLYGESKGDPPRLIRQIACVTPHCLFDLAHPAIRALAGALRLLSSLGFSCRVFCGSWIATPGARGPEDLLAEQGLSHATRRKLIEDRHYRLFETQLDQVSVTIFNDGPFPGCWSSKAASRDFLLTCGHFLEENRPDAVLSFGGESVTNAMISAAKGCDIPVVHWLYEQRAGHRKFFHNVDYVVVASESYRERLWAKAGFACHVLPNASGSHDATPFESIYRNFFSNLWTQPGPPYVPRRVDSTALA